MQQILILLACLVVPICVSRGAHAQIIYESMRLDQLKLYEGMQSVYRHKDPKINVLSVRDPTGP